MDFLKDFCSFIADTYLAPACAQDPCSSGALPDLSGPDLSVQYAAESNDLWCSAGADAGPGIDYTFDDGSGCGVYGSWEQI